MRRLVSSPTRPTGASATVRTDVGPFVLSGSMRHLPALQDCRMTPLAISHSIWASPSTRVFGSGLNAAPAWG